jgi:hypothetical protein
LGLDIGVLVLMVAGLLAAIALYLSDLHNARLRAVHMEKMRNGAMYQELNDILSRCRRRYVEQVRIRRECVEFLMMLPAGRRVVYSLEARGYRPLTPQRQQTLCALIKEDLPLLEDRARYSLRKEKQSLSNGETTVEYVFTMRTAYKDALNRAPYYMRG